MLKSNEALQPHTLYLLLNHGISTGISNDFSNGISNVVTTGISNGISTGISSGIFFSTLLPDSNHAAAPKIFEVIIWRY